MSDANQKDQLINKLKTKVNLLSEVLEITKAQKHYIVDDDMEKLLSEMDSRQKLIDEVLRLDSTIDRAFLKELVASGDMQITNLDNIIREALKSIALEDKQNISSAESKVTEYKEQIRIIKGEKNRMSSYTNVVTNSDGIFIDKKK